MNKFLMLAGLFLVVALVNLLNVYMTGSGFSLVLGIAWLAASAFIFVKYRKMNIQKQKDEEKEEAV